MGTPILIFDEATSALDSANERAIQAELQSVAQNKITLVGFDGSAALLRNLAVAANDGLAVESLAAERARQTCILL